MKVSAKEVAYVADLANLELTPAEQEAMVRDLNNILGYIDMLNELDTSSVEPMAQVEEMKGGGVSAAGMYTLRDDKLKPSLPHDAALANAPDHDQNFFKVPKVIER